jgi:hypothetical protein
MAAATGLLCCLSPIVPAPCPRFFVPSARERHFMFDLAGYVAARLAAAGIGAARSLWLAISAICLRKTSKLGSP